MVKFIIISFAERLKIAINTLVFINISRKTSNSFVFINICRNFQRPFYRPLFSITSLEIPSFLGPPFCESFPLQASSLFSVA